jgi:hypothetical protein
MTISLSVVQQLLVLTALAWAIVPTWGGLAFAATWSLMFLGTRVRSRRARKLLADHLDTLTTLPPESKSLMKRFPLYYVWPTTAVGWGTTWQLTGLLALILAATFVVRALLWWDAVYLLLLLPLTAQLLAGGGMARHLKPNERVREDLKELRATHDTTMTVLHLKRLVGQWPPEPAPDPEGEPAKQKP